MTYGMVVSEKELEVLDNNNIDYIFWDFEGLLKNRSPYIEIEFDNQTEAVKAKKILNR